MTPSSQQSGSTYFDIDDRAYISVNEMSVIRVTTQIDVPKLHKNSANHHSSKLPARDR